MFTRGTNLNRMAMAFKIYVIVIEREEGNETNEDLHNLT